MLSAARAASGMWGSRRSSRSRGARGWDAPIPRRRGNEAFHEQNDIDLAVWWALSRPGVFLASAGDVDLLPKVLDAASRFAGAPADAAMTEPMNRSAAQPLFV
ncbi:MAG TPA: hypothetical protein VLM11_12035 [Streptosporangiaceae bacterium]|nr:hypothetical protein [Streptosporangiaceae bacterium]